MYECKLNRHTPSTFIYVLYFRKTLHASSSCKKKKTWTTTNRTQRILWDSFLSIHAHNHTESINQTMCYTRVTCTCFSFIIIVVWMKRTHVRLINETTKIFVRIKICDYLKASSIGSFKFNFPSAIYDSCLLGYCDFLLFSLLLLLYQINKRR